MLLTRGFAGRGEAAAAPARARPREDEIAENQSIVDC